MAFAALQSISRTEERIRPLIKKNVVQVLLNALKDTSFDVVGTCLLSLVNICLVDAGSLAEIVNKNIAFTLVNECLPRLVQQKGCQEIVASCLDLMALLAEQSDKALTQFSEYDIFNLICSHQVAEQSSRSLIFALLEFLYVFTEASSPADKGEVPQFLVSLMSSQDTSVKLLAAGVVANLMKSDSITSGNHLDAVIDTCCQVLRIDDAVVTDALSKISKECTDEDDLEERAKEDDVYAQGLKCFEHLRQTNLSLEILSNLLLDESELLYEENEEMDSEVVMDDDIADGDDGAEWEADVAAPRPSDFKKRSEYVLSRLVSTGTLDRVVSICMSELPEGTCASKELNKAASSLFFIRRLRSYGVVSNMSIQLNASTLACHGDDPSAVLTQLFKTLLDQINALYSKTPDLQLALLLESCLSALSALGHAMTEDLQFPVSSNAIADGDVDSLLVLWLGWYKKSFVPAGVTVPQEMTLLLANIRSHLITILDVISTDPQLSPEHARQIGEFLLCRMELPLMGGNADIPIDDNPTVISEVINTYLDLFGPDTHNAVFDSIGHLSRLQTLIPVLKPAVKKIDPRKRLQPRFNGEWAKEIAMRVDLDMRAVRDRLWDMQVNLTRFVKYKLESSPSGR